ncbi:MAG: AAA family ATPase [Phycisphaeraceae bacterium]
MTEPSPSAVQTVADQPNIVVRATEPPPPRSRQPAKKPRLIALMNQKGGVGKTTTAVNLGAALTTMGSRVLLIDLDPQAHLTLHMGLDPASLDNTVYDLMTRDEVTAGDIVRHVNDKLSVLPAEMNLAGVETELAPKMATGSAQQILKDKCTMLLSPTSGAQNPTSESEQAQAGDDSQTPDSGPRTFDSGLRPFDYVFIDCPPSLGLLTINSLTLANEVIVPMQAHFLALQGLSRLLETVTLIRRSFNPQLSVSAMLLCMYEGQTILANEVITDLTAFLDASRAMDVPWRDATILQPPVRRNIKLAESPSFGKTIFDYAPDCHGAEDYKALAQALMGQQVTRRS